MASRFLVPDRDQLFLKVMSYRDMVPADDLVWTVIEVVEGLDLSDVYDRYGVESLVGRPAFDPTMMLTLLVFGYCEGKRSSRELETACRRDVAYQVICGGMTPDHATIARFRVGLDDLMESLFIKVLAVCAGRGLVQVARVAVDGTKMGGVGSKDSNRTAGYLAGLEVEVRQILAEVDVADVTGPRNDSDSSGAFPVDSDSTSTGSGDGGGWSLVRREAETQGKLERVQQARVEVEEAGQRRAHDEARRGRKRPGIPTANLTDPDSRLQKTRGGFIQGYNGQAVVSGDQIVVAADLTAQTTDVGMFEPMLDRTLGNLTAVGISDPIATVLADAGYWSLANSLLEDRIGATLLIATGKRHKVGTVTSDVDHENDSPAAIARHQMEIRLTDVSWREEYQQRGWLIEGCFAHTKTHRRSGRFQRRGLIACDAEWKLIHLAGNILKIHRQTCQPVSDDRGNRRHSRIRHKRRCSHHRQQQPQQSNNPPSKPIPNRPNTTE